MSASIDELITGPTVTLDADRSVLEYNYSIIGAASAEAALTLLITTADLSKTVDGIELTKRTFRIEPEGTIFIGRVEYSRPSPRDQEPLPENQSSYQFETGGGTANITTSLETIETSRVDGETPIDCQNAINWDGTNVNGVDIVIPNFTFSETHALPDSSVTGTYKTDLFRATGKVNDATFKGFAAGEVLFLGASGSKRADGPWEITYRFAASENMTGLTVGEITGINKKGWEYLWTFFTPNADGDLLVKRPEQVFVEKVYESYDFSKIGIGTT
jgi:hypothetical protein